MNDLHKKILENLPSGVWVTDSEDKVIYINKAMTGIAGASAEKFTGLFVFKDLDKPGNLNLLNCYRKVKQNLFPGEYEVRLKDSSGKGFVHRGWLTPLINNGKFDGMIVTAEDITEKDIFEEALKDSEEKFRRTIEFAADGILLGSHKGFVIEANQAACELFGMSKKDMLNLHITKMPFTNESLERTPMRFDLLKEGKTVISERTIQKNDGSEVLIEMKTKMMIDGSYQSIYRDITERKRIENALRENEEKYRTLFEESNDAIYLMSGDTFIDCNGQAVKMFECSSREEMINQKPMDFSPKIQPDGRSTYDLVQEHINSAGNGHPQRFNWKHRKKDGTFFDAEVSLNRIILGKKIFLQAIVRDITERRKAEDALRESENFYKSLVETTDTGYVVISSEGKVLDANAKYISLTGNSSLEEVRGKSVLEWTAEYEKEKNEKAVLVCISKGFIRNLEIDYIDKKGKITPVEINATVIAIDETLQIITLCRDISERKKGEDELKKHRENLEELVEKRTLQLQNANKELESFSYSVSHDLRAPVRHISGFTDILKKSLGTDPDSSSSSAIEKIRMAAKKMEMLIDDLLEFSKTGRLELSKNKTDMLALVKTVKKEVSDSLPDRKIEWKISELPFVYCDRNLMRIVWENLIGNACKYSSGKKAVIEIGFSDKGNEIEFFIKDNGIGFDPEFTHKLFGVFQRLHLEKDFPGTGIGLATIRRIVSRHGGSVRAESKGEGSGAVFYFTLPKEGGHFEK